jgi:hypothetical protein
MDVKDIDYLEYIRNIQLQTITIITTMQIINYPKGIYGVKNISYITLSLYC